jgi:hypothetical protein
LPYSEFVSRAHASKFVSKAVQKIGNRFVAGFFGKMEHSDAIVALEG